MTAYNHSCTNEIEAKVKGVSNKGAVTGKKNCKTRRGKEGRGGKHRRGVFFKWQKAKHCHLVCLGCNDPLQRENNQGNTREEKEIKENIRKL